MPTADAHVHLFPNGYAGTSGLLLQNELETYERLRVQFGIERALVVGYEGEPRYRGNNDYILELARTRPWLVPLAYLEASTVSADRLRQLRQGGAAGYSLYVRDDPAARSVCAWPQAVVRELNEQRALLSLNATPAATAALVPFVDALAGCTIFFSHLGLPGRFAHVPNRGDASVRLRPLLALADRLHVHVKFSGLYAISEPPHDFPHPAARPFVDALLSAFGVTRLCWGSDFAPALEFVSFGQLSDARLLADLGAGAVAAVMGANLNRLLGAVRRKE